MPLRTLALFLLCLGLTGLFGAACGGDDSDNIDSANQTASADDDGTNGEDGDTGNEDDGNEDDGNGGDGEDGDPREGSASVFDLREGDCFNANTDDTVNEVELVDCAEAHQYEVTNLFDVPDADTFPGDEYFQDEAVDNCDEGTVTYLAPSADTWDVGDRVVICLAEG